MEDYYEYISGRRFNSSELHKKKPVKLALRFLLCGKALDDADTGEVLVDIRRNIGRFFSERLPSLVCDDLNKIHADSDQRQHENRT